MRGGRGRPGQGGGEKVRIGSKGRRETDRKKKGGRGEWREGVGPGTGRWGPGRVGGRGREGDSRGSTRSPGPRHERDPDVAAAGVWEEEGGGRGEGGRTSCCATRITLYNPVIVALLTTLHFHPATPSIHPSIGPLIPLLPLSFSSSSFPPPSLFLFLPSLPDSHIHPNLTSFHTEQPKV